MQTSRPLNRLQADLLLLLTAAVWGSGFIAQRIAAPNMNIFIFMFINVMCVYKIV